MSAREASAVGREFTPRAGSFSDPGVALDEILSLRPNHEPVVLRVAVEGGSARQRQRLRGDWLCRPSEEPRRLPRPRWTYSSVYGQDRRDTATSDRWSEPREWVEAWEGCSVPKWMVYEAAKALSPVRSVSASLCCLELRLSKDFAGASPAATAAMGAMRDWVASGGARWPHRENEFVARLMAEQRGEEPESPRHDSLSSVCMALYAVEGAATLREVPSNFGYMLALSVADLGSSYCDVVRSEVGTAEVLSAVVTARRR